MNKNKEYSLILEDISFPLIFSSYKKEVKDIENPSLTVLYKIHVHIISPDTIEILFGSQVIHKQEEPPFKITVEILGVFKFKEKIFNNKSEITVGSIKSLPNMLAILFPFIREKIYSLLSNNKIIFYLLPLNTMELVKDLKDKIKILDKRQNQSK